MLTPELVALTVRTIEDPGPSPDFIPAADADHDEVVAETLAGRPEGDFWLFACGSLIWRPACDVLDHRVGTVRGWHRAFRLEIRRWRGSDEQPGLMMGLDRGGQCTSVLYRLPPDKVEENLGKLVRREMSRRPSANVPRWLRVETADGPLTAMAFVLDRKVPVYTGPRSYEETADILARACGHGGSGAEYLHNTLVKLVEHGIYDRNLWALDRLVAQKIRELHDGHG